ncbi:MAG: OmpA family protein [Hyphomonadaceae bacterium]|nr:OmpA family protein [Hyphomonadaceae bacterium]
MSDDNQDAGKPAAAKKTTRATKAAKGALGAVGGLVGGAAAAAAGAAKAAGEAAGEAVSSVTEAVGDAAGGAVDAAKGVAGAVTDAVGDTVSGLTGAVGDVADGAVDAAKGVAGAVTDAVGDAVSGLTGAVGDVAGGAVDMVGKGAGAAAGAGAAGLAAAGAVAGGLVGGVGKGLGALSGSGSDSSAAGAYAGRGRLAGDEEEVDRTGGGWLVPLVGLVGIVGLAWLGSSLFIGKAPEETAVAAAPAAPAAPAVPAWLTAIGDNLKGTFAWLGLGGSATQVIASGTAPDQAAKDTALADLQAALTASAEGKDARVIDNIAVTGATDTPVGAALAALGPNPDVAACQKAFGDTMAGRTINFTTGSAVINDSSRSLLNALTGIASACASHTIEVGGHTDTVGLPENNQALSQSRAEAVKAFWVEAGVAATTLSAVGYGEAKLKEPTADQTANEANRRIEFTVTAAGAAPAAPAAPSDAK